MIRDRITPWLGVVAALLILVVALTGCAKSAPAGPVIEPEEDRRNCAYLETMREMNPGEYPTDDELLRGCP